MSGGVAKQNRMKQGSDGAISALTAHDLAWIEGIVQRVIQQLQADDTAESQITQRVVTEEAIEQIDNTVGSVAISFDAVVTPAAKDAARRRGIRLKRRERSNRQNVSGEHNVSLRVVDTHDLGRCQHVESQLRRRGVKSLQSRIVLSDSPAATVVREVRGGEVAVMVSSLDEVSRFISECQPTTWVLDMKRLNMSGAVNVAALISKLGSSLS